MKTMIAAALLGLAAGHFGTGSVGSNDTDSSRTGTTVEAQASPATTTLRLSGYEYRSAEANQAISADVGQAANHIDQAFAQAPHVAAAMARSIDTNGPVKAILYEDPEVKSATDSMAASLGRGLRALGDAIARDMIEGEKQLHPSRA